MYHSMRTIGALKHVHTKHYIELAHAYKYNDDRNDNNKTYKRTHANDNVLLAACECINIRKLLSKWGLTP